MTTEETDHDCAASLSTAGLCGCGRPIRHMTYKEQGQALAAANTKLLALLCIIHRDGGHHPPRRWASSTATVGIMYMLLG